MFTSIPFVFALSAIKSEPNVAALNLSKFEIGVSLFFSQSLSQILFIAIPPDLYPSSKTSCPLFNSLIIPSIIGMSLIVLSLEASIFISASYINGCNPITLADLAPSIPGRYIEWVNTCLPEIVFISDDDFLPAVSSFWSGFMVNK